MSPSSTSIPGEAPSIGPAFRRQFAMGRELPDSLAGWARHPVHHDLQLAVHPELSCVRVDRNDTSVLLVGYVLDPRHPGRDDRTIIEHVMDGAPTFEDVLRAFDPLSGRWMAIHRAGDDIRLFHDAAGLRMVHYAHGPGTTTSCASTPSLLAQFTGLPADVEQHEELDRAGIFARGTHHFWPGDGAPYIGMHRLLPNHFLDLRTGAPHRFWPHTPLPEQEPSAAVAPCTASLEGTISAALARYPLSLALTAGLDSRLLLAASRQHVEELSFHTLRKTGMTDSSRDIRLPRQILGDLGLDHRVIPVRTPAAGPVAETLRRTFLPCHEQTVDQVVALAEHPAGPRGRWVTVNGNVSEVGRNFYPRTALTPDRLAGAVGMGRSRYAVDAFARWLEDAAPALATSGLNGWDLFHWEQKIGGWLAGVRTEFDLAEEAVHPYNSRELLENLLRVPSVLREGPDYPFHREMIGHLWPELLAYPINPPERGARLRRRYRRGRGAARRVLARVVPALRRDRH